MNRKSFCLLIVSAVAICASDLFGKMKPDFQAKGLVIQQKMLDQPNQIPWDRNPWVFRFAPKDNLLDDDSFPSFENPNDLYKHWGLEPPFQDPPTHVGEWTKVTWTKVTPGTYPLGI